MKWIVLLVLVAGCGGKSNDVPETPVVYKSFQVRCPLNTIESTTDTIKADRYYYEQSALNFYRDNVMFTYKQFPSTCVVKELP